MEMKCGSFSLCYSVESMAQRSNREKQQAHELIERLGPKQVSAVVGLLEALLDPVSRAIANAPTDDEPESEQERQAVAESKAWFERRGGQGIPQEQVLADFDPPTNELKKKRN
jgi:hypothetical protein